MQWGIKKYLNNTGYAANYNETTVLWPEFDWIEEEVERCEDVVLLLGFWQNYTGYYERVGGHYVTVAGVNSNTSQLSISDPYFDSVGNATPGMHNDTQYVSHDIYNVTNIFPNNMSPCWALQNYAGGKNITNFIGQNGGPSLPPGAYNQSLPVVTIIDYAVDVSPTTTTLEGHVGLQGFPATNVTVRFFDPGTQNETMKKYGTTDASGNFTIGNLIPGTYDVAVKGQTSLSNLVTGVDLSVPGRTDFGALLEGDSSSSNDDYIDGSDYGPLSNAWNSYPGITPPPAWDPNVDFSRDDYIDGSDYGPLSSNWNDWGDTFGWPGNWN